MEILIDGKPAAMKKGTTFDFVSENRYFSGADSYSMAITFPLKDCPQNLEIFGHINRLDVAKDHILFDCEIRDQAFYKRGSITITAISAKEVKTQFLEGKSVTNYDSSFDSVYLNEMTLGYPDTNPATYPANYHAGYIGGMNWLALPWVNNNTGNVQNDVKLYHEAYQDPEWKASGLSFQPYMIYIVKRIFEVMGYTYDLSEWENSKYAHLLICNALPYAWGIREFAAALPHWTLTEFFEQLEYLLNGEFDINHSLHTVRFRFTKSVLATTQDVELTRVVDEFSSEVQKLEDCKYRECKNLKYADCDHYMWKYYVCPDVIKWAKSKHSSWYKEYNTMSDLCNALRSYLTVYYSEITKTAVSRLYYVKDIDRYYILRRVSFTRTGEFDLDGDTVPTGNFEMFIQCINAFEGLTYSPDADDIELKIVPAWIGDTNHEDGPCIFLQLPDYAGEGGHKPYNGYNSWEEAIPNLSPECDMFIRLHAEEKSNGDNEYLDKIYVGFYPGMEIDEDFGVPMSGYSVYIYPYIDTIRMSPQGWFTHTDYSLRLQHDDLYAEHHSRKIDPTMKYTFKFLSDTMPDVRSVFFIHGQRYVAEKITCNFTENGMSNLMKMDAWQIVD